MNTEAMFSSETDEWATPQDFFNKLNEEFSFDLDVCALPENTKCQQYFSPEDDGLSQIWRGTCWMNPPYGRGIYDWVRKAYTSSRLGATVVCLVPARTDTSWWHQYCTKGEIRFVRGRLKFGDQSNSAPFPSAVVIFYPQVEQEHVTTLKRSLKLMLNLGGAHFFSRFLGRSGLVLTKFKPEILLGLGLVGFGATIFLACKATLKVEEILDTAAEQNEKIEQVRERVVTEQNTLGGTMISYSEQDYKHDKMIVMAKTGVALAKLYGPALLVGGATIALIGGSYHVLSARNAAVVGLYKATTAAFEKYRARLIDDVGVDKDKQYRYGITQQKVDLQKTDLETGEEKTVKTVTNVINPADMQDSLYARYFQPGNPNWSDRLEHNLTFLKGQQDYANNRYQTVGHVFLNEVYESIGIPHSDYGAVTGWVNNGKGDGFIDFGFEEIIHKLSTNEVRGYLPFIKLDFNVDGVIWNLI
jgi:phage N-6-adenine-methyltransferase